MDLVLRVDEISAGEAGGSVSPIRVPCVKRAFRLPWWLEVGWKAGDNAA